jgi:hypothetical protein
MDMTFLGRMMAAVLNAAVHDKVREAVLERDLEKCSRQRCNT